MKQMKETCIHFSCLKVLSKSIHYFLAAFKVLLESVYCRLKGIPPVSRSVISREIIRECVGKEDPTILEIGCNDGSNTLWFLETFKNPKVYCFEPEPRAIARFKEKVGERFNIKLFEIALSDHNGEVDFYQSGVQLDEGQANAMPQGWDRSGSIRQPKEHLMIHPRVTFDRKITVMASTLDAWCDKHGIGTIDFIWMDVQGAEIDVFRGAKNTLAKTRFIYTEYSNLELYKGQFNLRKLMEHLKNFNVMIRYPGDVLLRNKRLVGEPHRGCSGCS